MGSRGGTGAATAIAVPVWTAGIRRGVSSTEAIDSSLVRPPGIGHSIGLGYVVLTLRELAGLSQNRLARRSRTSQPAIARLESGRQVPSVNTLIRLASACGMHLVVGLADPDVDVADLCMHDLTLLGVLRPAPDGLVDFFAIREPPPWAGGG